MYAYVEDLDYTIPSGVLSAQMTSVFWNSQTTLGSLFLEFSLDV